MLLTDTTHFEIPTVGVHPARCFRVIDLGSQKTEWDGIERESRKVQISFELLGDERMGDGRPFTVSRRFTASLHEKAALRSFLESWRGRKFVRGELNGFDVAKLLGVYVLVNLVATERNGRRFADIASISPLPKSMARGEPVNELIHFSLDTPDWDAFDKLHERTRATISATREYRMALSEKALGTVRAREATVPPAAKAAAAADPFADLNEDIPWPGDDTTAPASPVMMDDPDF